MSKAMNLKKFTPPTKSPLPTKMSRHEEPEVEDLDPELEESQIQQPTEEGKSHGSSFQATPHPKKGVLIRERAKTAPTTPLQKENEAAEEGEDAASSDGEQRKRAPRHPNGHKCVNVATCIQEAQKTKYLPLSENQHTSQVYFQPKKVEVVTDYWCEVEMLVLVLGSQFAITTAQISLSGDELLRMCYLHYYFLKTIAAEGEDRPENFESWLAGVYQEYANGHSNTDFSHRGRIADYYMSTMESGFEISVNGRVQSFFQKKCVRDFEEELPTECEVWAPNANNAFGRALKGKFEYEIVHNAMVIPSEKDRTVAPTDACPMDE